MILNRKSSNYLEDEGDLKRINEQDGELKIKITKIVSHIICLIYTSTNFFVALQEIYDQGLFLTSDDKIDFITYPQSMYFVIVTLTTLGYGDFTPHNPLVRIFLTILLIFYIAIISKVINNF